MKLGNIKRKISEIIEGYYKTIFHTKEEKNLSKERMLIIKEVCKCQKYLINIKIPFSKTKRIKLFAYCKECGCNLIAKSYCKKCSCTKGFWLGK